MIRKIMVLLGLLVLFLPASLVLAGGWAVITVDELPGAIRAGDTAEISFTVRAHGRAPADGLSPFLSARNEATGERIQVAAKPAAEAGRYSATVVFPSAGEWSWSIAAKPYPQRTTLTPLTVEPALASATAPGPALDLQLALRWAGLALLVASGLMLALGRLRQPGDVVAAGD